LLIEINERDPLQVQIYRALRDAILRGRYPAGSRLPSTRALAADAGVARNTVSNAYDQLLGEGYAVTRHGSGTYVTAELPDAMTAVARPAGPPAARAVDGAAPRLSRLGRTVQGWRVTFERDGCGLAYDFRHARPALRDFPYATWRRLLTRRVRSASERDLEYGPPAGAPALREAIARHLQRARGIVGDAGQVLVVNGAQQALDLVARVLIESRDRVLFEEPHYAAARGVFLGAGARLVTLPVDAEGLDVTRLDRRVRGIRLAYVTPSHQFPTGVVMSLARRVALLSWAERENVWVVEDDYDGEYRYSGRPLQSLQGLDRTGRVLYMGTFSKLMFPALRLGYLVLPRPLVKAFRSAKGLADGGTATLEQLALADFIAEGHFERHVRLARARNAARRNVLVEAVAEHLGNRVEISGDSAGTYVLLWLRDIPPRQVDRYVARARAASVGIYSAASFFAKEPPRGAIILSYAALAETDIREGILRLGAVLRRGAA
jgi:GntR family transcriptional regulator/MocR family aminotransferase